jgi:hypothetical protein
MRFIILLRVELLLLLRAPTRDHAGAIAAEM